MSFTALVDFYSEETKSQYVAGLSYTARAESLRALVRQWAAEGKVCLGGPVATIEGRG